MRILVIGGNGFIGSPLVNELLGSGHDVAVFHRRSDVGLAASGVVRIQGDRNRLFDYEGQLRRFSPDVIVDLILSSGEQARQLVEIAHAIGRRVIAISSMDVYRAWGVALELEAGPLDPLPITEDSPLRTTRKVYPQESLKILRNTFTWLNEDYDKIAVEEAIQGDPAVSWSILRLPMVYGPGDPLHRCFPLLKRIADGRSSVLFSEDFAAWRVPRGYVDNVAHAIAVVATSDQAAGRIYNICDEPSLSEHAWQSKVAKQMNWKGRFVLLPRGQTPKHLLQPGNAAQHLVASSDRIRTGLGYEEPVELEEAIRRTIAWEQQNPPSIVNPQLFDYSAEDAALIHVPLENQEGQDRRRK